MLGEAADDADGFAWLEEGQEQYRFILEHFCAHPAPDIEDGKFWTGMLVQWGKGGEECHYPEFTAEALLKDDRWADRAYRTGVLEQLRTLVRKGWAPQGSEDRVEVLPVELTYVALRPLLLLSYASASSRAPPILFVNGLTPASSPPAHATAPQTWR